MGKKVKLVNFANFLWKLEVVREYDDKDVRHW